MLVWTEAVELVDRLYQEKSGEVDDTTEAADAWAEFAAADAVEHLARFVRWCEHGLNGIKAETERLAMAAKRVEGRIAWAKSVMLEILDEAGKKSMAAGPFRVRSRAGSKRVEIGEGFELEAAPAEIKRWVEPKPGRWDLDKKAARAYLEDPDQMPVHGLSIVRGPRSVIVD